MHSPCLSFLCVLSFVVVIASRTESYCAEDEYTNTCGPKFIGYDNLTEYKSIYGETATAGIKIELTDAMNNDGARCLDGSVGVFYFRKGFDDGINKFHIFLKGGGACAGITEPVTPSSAADTCAHRATTSLGSSNTYQNTSNYDNGYLSTNNNTNPLTYNWNTIYVMYCGGSFYGSNNETVIEVNANLTLYFREFRILKGVFDELMKPQFGFGNASDLLLSGCSAGALATFTHSDWIYHHKLPEPTHMAGMPDSGFFLEYEGNGKTMTIIQWQYDWMNVTESLNTDCLSSQQDEYKYLCIWPQEVAPYSFVNMFALQSQYDSWQIKHELVSNNATAINEYGQNLTATIMNTYLTGSKHNMFLSSCSYHCGEWNEIRIDGYLASQAQYEWYTEQGTHAPLWYQNKTYPCTECCSPNK